MSREEMGCIWRREREDTKLTFFFSSTNDYLFLSLSSVYPHWDDSSPYVCKYDLLLRNSAPAQPPLEAIASCVLLTPI